MSGEIFFWNLFRVFHTSSRTKHNLERENNEGIEQADPLEQRGSSTPEEFENRGFTRKTLQSFPSTLHGRNLKTQQSPVILDLSLIKLGQRNHMIIVKSSFSKTSFLKRFLSKRKRKASVFKFLRFEERFRKAPFWRRISVDGRPNRRNKAAFSKFLRRSVDGT